MLNFLFPFFVLLSVGIALIWPTMFVWVVPFIVPLLGIVMFGMGITLKPEDFKAVLKAPKIVFIGLIAQYVVMSGLAYGIVHLLHLPTEIAIGVILVGTCPGGTASNVITLLAKGDLALSVSLTACSTLLSPIITPALTMLLANQWLDINYIGMFLSILKIVIIPVILGMICNKIFAKHNNKMVKITPIISMIAIILIIGAVLAINAQRLLHIAAVTVVAVILHNVLGLTIGYYIGKAFGFDFKRCKTLSIEVGLQNSGLATSLSKTHFASTPEAMLPAAFFSVWHNISGALLASYWNIKNNKK